MKTVIFLAFSLLCLPAALGAQSMMRMYRMMYSISGSYASGSSGTDIKFEDGTSGTDIDHETVRIASRNGYFVSRNVAMGLELSWEQTRGESNPTPNTANYRFEQFERHLFIGPLFRWYLPMTVRWFLYPEIAAGYRHYLGESEVSSSSITPLPVTTTARGVGVNAGLGVGYFLSRNVALDVTARYSHHWLSGSYERPGQPDIDAEITGGEIGILFGLQLLM
jgi:opacity protein-like surface antigen